MNWSLPAALALLSAAGCTKAAPSQAGDVSQDRSEGLAVSQDAAVASSPELKAPRTTDGAVALGNFDTQIRGTEALLARSPTDAALGRRLVDMLLTRGQFRGTISDYERADTVAAMLVSAHPDSGDAHLARAATLGTFHLFAQSIQEADAAERAKAPSEGVLHVRATAFMAQGRFDEAEALGIWRDPNMLDVNGLATAAVLAGERGRAAESEALFDRARTSYRDVSPFPVAWFDFQRGWLLERKGDRARAKLYFAEAHAALPAFAHAAVHLAAMETPDQGRLLLEPLLGKSDDPEVDAAYGDALRRLGRPDEAKPFVTRAKSRYEDLLAKHPEAFADHAAAFFLGIGQDPGRALVFAKLNADNRQTEAALELLLESALAAGKHEDACDAAVRGEALRYATPAFRVMAKATRAGCAAPSAPVGSP